MFWYLATPYSEYPGGYEAAAELSAKLAARLLEAGVPVFAPIAHSHPISKHVSVVSNTDHDFWMNVDAPFMEAAHGLVIVTAPEWEESRGMRQEIDTFTKAGKPVVYWYPEYPIPEEITNV